MKFAVSFCVAVAAMAWSAAASAQSKQPLIVGTGASVGVYYAVGGALCRILNRYRQDSGLVCAAETTGGSAANIEAVRQRDITLGLVQADVQAAAYRGEGNYAGRPYPALRTLFSVHTEAATVVVASALSANRIEDLRGRRFNVGNPGSGQAQSLAELMTEMNWSRANFAAATELTANEQGPAFCAGQIDGFFYVVGHPAAAIAQPLAECGGRLVPLGGEAVDALLRRRPELSRTEIAGGLYPNQPNPVPTYGVAATVVADASLPAEQARFVVRTLFENLAEFRGLHPAFAGLADRSMAVDGLVAPLHDAARAYYVERGWR